MNSFTKNHNSYGRYSFLQKEIAKTLLGFGDVKRFKRVLDLGAGDGYLYSFFPNVEKYIALDISPNMLNLHPSGKNIFKLVADFDEVEFSNFQDIDLVISNSAMQWSKNLPQLCKKIDSIPSAKLFSIFTSNTFHEIQSYFDITSPIVDRYTILDSCNRFEYFFENRQIGFNSTLELLRYIRYSGVSGNLNSVKISQLRDAINRNKLKTLSVEVVYLAKL